MPPWNAASSRSRSRNPPSPHAIEILKGLRDRYEAHHRVTITDGALASAASLSERYISDRFLPDKAIDLIDEAGARLRIRRMTAPPELKVMDEKIAAMKLEKESAIDAQDFEGAAALRDKEQKLIAERAEKERQWKTGGMDDISEVDEDLIAEVLANSTGIPVFKLTEEESSRLLKMEDELHKRVVGQDEAIRALSQAIRRTRAGLKDPKRPGGSFIFAGPTGVGKTELAKALAEFLFGEEDALITLDMSEYSEKHTVSRLFGAPPGYVGYEEGGQLTEKVRRRPFSVVLFDEVEKAHADLFNSLLQILEDGRLTDSQGRVVDFKNTVIIMTTNLGTRDISKSVATGFQSGTDTQTGYNRMRARVTEELKQHFRPEFLNRVDDVVVFPQLTQDEIIEIVDMMWAGWRSASRTRTWASSSPRPPRCSWQPAATIPRWAPGRCAGPSSARSRTSSPRRSSSANCTAATSWWWMWTAKATTPSSPSPATPSRASRRSPRASRHRLRGRHAQRPRPLRKEWRGLCLASVPLSGRRGGDHGRGARQP